MTTNKNNTAVAKIEKGGFVALNMKEGELLEVFRANLGDETISPFDLPRIKIPTGGGSTWEVPTIDGTENVKEITGVIVAWRNCRGYWGEGFAGGNPPLCQSLDGKVGTGLRWEGDDPTGHICHNCAFSKWGSKMIDGTATKGQACKAMRRLFILQEDDLLPKLLTLPPTSLKACSSFFMAMISQQKHFSDYVLIIGLTQQMNADGIKYAVAAFALGRELSRPERARVAAYERMIEPLFLMSVDTDGAAVEPAPAAGNYRDTQEAEGGEAD